MNNLRKKKFTNKLHTVHRRVHQRLMAGTPSRTPEVYNYKILSDLNSDNAE